MKKIYITSTLLALALFTGCGDDEFSAQHNQGKNCLECHSFKSGATIFRAIDAKDYDEKATAQDFHIQLKLDNGQVIKFEKGNGLGNFKYSGDVSQINTFTPQVIDANGKVVNQSTENSHDRGRLACNRCHTQSGINGAPGRIVNFDYLHNILTTTNPTTNNPTPENNQSNPQPRSLSFSQDIMPILTNNCKQCHGNSGNYTVTDAQSTYNNISSIGMLDTMNPTQSRMLRKPTTDGLSHGGGKRFDKSDEKYKTILTWIQQGAKNN